MCVISFDGSTIYRIYFIFSGDLCFNRPSYRIGPREDGNDNEIFFYGRCNCVDGLECDFVSICRKSFDYCKGTNEIGFQSFEANSVHSALKYERLNSVVLEEK